nr:hypothetical protein [uncultured Desulfobacter sp.]
MKTFLVILVSLSYSCGIGSIIAFGIYKDVIPYKLILSFFFVSGINLAAAKYLFYKSPKCKAEWALFGAIGNINAILIFWLCGALWKNLKKGKSSFGRDSGILDQVNPGVGRGQGADLNEVDSRGGD